MGYVGKGSATQVLTDNAATVLPSFQAAGGGGGAGAAKAWGNFNFDISNNTASVNSSFNVTSIVGSGGGTATVTFTSALSATNPSVVLGSNDATNTSNDKYYYSSYSTTQLVLQISISGTSTGTFSFAVFQN